MLYKIKIHFPDEILVQDHSVDSSAEMRIVHYLNRTEIDLIYLLRPTLITLRKTCNEYRCLVCL